MKLPNRLVPPETVKVIKVETRQGSSPEEEEGTDPQMCKGGLPALGALPQKERKKK